MSQVHERRVEVEGTAEHLPGAVAGDRSFLGRDPTPVRVAFGGRSHTRKVRPNNEDHFMVVRRQRRRDLLLGNLPPEDFATPPEDAYVIVVADGMGGAAFGELASFLALQVGWETGLRDVKWTHKVDRTELAELMRKAEAYYDEIDRALIEHTRLHPRLVGMGTTLTLAYTIGTEAIIAHAGDSRAYRHRRDGTLERLTRDHTLAQELADFGAIRPEEVERHRLRHVLTNCLGGPGPGVDPDIAHVRLADGDGLLLCTDGLSDLVTDAEIAETLSAVADPDAACAALLDRALDRGGRDNITVVLGRYRIEDRGKDEG